MKKEFFRNLQAAVEKRQTKKEQVNVELVKIAKNIVFDRPLPKTFWQAFLFFAAVNYLNFAVKSKAEVGYSFKSRVPDAVIVCLRKFKDIHFYGEKQKHAVLLYVEFYGFVFSFHGIGMNEDLAAIISGNPPIAFDGVRKQFCAGYIFKRAMALSKEKKETTNKRSLKQ